MATALLVALVTPTVSQAAAFRITGSGPSYVKMYVKRRTKRQLTPRFLASGDKVKSWSSSKRNVATVSKTGKITAKKLGTTTITAKTKNGKKDTIKIQVVTRSYPIKKLTISTSLTMKVGQYKRPSIKTSPSAQKTTSNVKWSSSKTSVATVNQAGFIRAVSPGKATITAKASTGKKDKTALTVIGIVPARKNLTVKEGESYKLKTSVYPSKPAPGRKATSAHTDIATVKVNSDGTTTISAKMVGTTTVTITTSKGSSAGSSTKVTVLVTKNPVIVDLSKWQGKIDWKAASAGIDLAILRVQDVGPNSAKPNPIDTRYEEYSKACQTYDIPFGVYAYARYETKAEAEKEAKLFYDRATKDGRQPLFYVVDCEAGIDPLDTNASKTYAAAFKKDKKLVRKNTEYFLAKVRALAAASATNPRPRVKTGVYVAHHLYTRFNLNLSTDTGNSKTPDFIWIPRYGTNDGSLEGSKLPDYSTDVWQYTSTGTIPGISGAVDMNAIYDQKGAKLSAKPTFDFAWLTTP
jgi:GH25 family lysozyme M1 (1,4-beta-N-acetylmuramidase)